MATMGVKNFTLNLKDLVGTDRVGLIDEEIDRFNDEIFINFKEVNQDQITTVTLKLCSQQGYVRSSDNKTIVKPNIGSLLLRKGKRSINDNALFVVKELDHKKRGNNKGIVDTIILERVISIDDDIVKFAHSNHPLILLLTNHGDWWGKSLLRDYDFEWDPCIEDMKTVPKINTHESSKKYEVSPSIKMSTNRNYSSCNNETRVSRSWDEGRGLNRIVHFNGKRNSNGDEVLNKPILYGSTDVSKKRWTISSVEPPQISSPDQSQNINSLVSEADGLKSQDNRFSKLLKPIVVRNIESYKQN